MKILYRSAFTNEEINSDVTLRTIPRKAFMEIHKGKNEKASELLYNGTDIDPDTK